MLDRSRAAAVTVALAAALLTTIGGAQASDAAKYPIGRASGHGSPFGFRRSRRTTRPSRGDLDNKRH
jgi:hypothetical protein